MITFSGKISPCAVMKDGKVVGGIYPVKNRRKYALDLLGKYWKRGSDEPTTIGGSPARWYGTLREAKAAAEKYA